jgi:hypothetical protein
MAFPQKIKDIFQFMRYRRYIIKHHDTGGTFNGVHRSEYFIDAVFIKTVFILLIQNDFLKLLQQLLVLKQIYV